MRYLLSFEERRFAEVQGRNIVWSDAMWTPSISASELYKQELNQIRHRLKMSAAFVSITNNETTSATGPLRLLNPDQDIPISLEWTAPFERTRLRIGVHGLNSQQEAHVLPVMQHFTQNPQPEKLGSILEQLAANPDVLIVLQHPYFDRDGAGEGVHGKAIEGFLKLHARRIHALELNGFRPASENLFVQERANALKLPAVAGGDRHGNQPNAVINLTNSRSFAEFVREIRVERRSYVYYLNEYRRDLRLRIVDAVAEILGDCPEHGLYWGHWSKRVFYRNEEDGSARSLYEIWNSQPPWSVSLAVTIIRTSRWRPVRRLVMPILIRNLGLDDIGGKSVARCAGRF